MDNVIGLLSLLAPFISGPLMAFFLAAAAETRHRRIAFWVLLLAINGVSFAVMAWSLDSFFFFIPCFLIPFTALASALISSWRGRSLSKAWGSEDFRWRWYRWTAVAVPLLQLSLIFWLTLLGPMMCERGWRPCSSW